jgi:SAM-dependent methyltransferase
VFLTEEWEALSDWWLEEVAGDPVYREDVLPLLLEVLQPRPGVLYLELGCGEGQAMRAVLDRGSGVVGCDLSLELLRRARPATVVRARLPELGWLRPGSVDGAYVVLVLEHLRESSALFRRVAVGVREGGCLALVMNHPAYTAPGAGPVVDPTDGAVLWQWGPYLEETSGREPAGEREVTFVHRPLGDLLSQAARAGWVLERLVERGIGEGAAARDPLLAEQRHIPRLLGARWRKG